jgi:hypothetical protein
MYVVSYGRMMLKKKMTHVHFSNVAEFLHNYLFTLIQCLSAYSEWCQLKYSIQRHIEFYFSISYLTTLSLSSLYSVDDRMINDYGAVGGMRFIL